MRFAEETTICSQPGVTLLAGRNGEGKTTFLRYLCGCQPEKPPTTYSHAYLPEELRLPEELAPADLVRAMVIEKSARAWFAESQAALDLPERAFGRLSKGNRQKVRVLLTLAIGMAQQTQLICMDEAMSGLDYAVRKVLWGILAKAGQRSRLIVSLHPDDIQIEPDQVLLVRRGSLFSMPPTQSWAAIEARLEGTD